MQPMVGQFLFKSLLKKFVTFYGLSDDSFFSVFTGLTLLNKNVFNLVHKGEPFYKCDIGCFLKLESREL